MSVCEETFQKGPSQAKAWRQDPAGSRSVPLLEGPRSANQEEKVGGDRSELWIWLCTEVVVPEGEGFA